MGTECIHDTADNAVVVLHGQDSFSSGVMMASSTVCILPTSDNSRSDSPIRTPRSIASDDFTTRFGLGQVASVLPSESWIDQSTFNGDSSHSFPVVKLAYKTSCFSGCI